MAFSRLREAVKFWIETMHARMAPTEHLLAKAIGVFCGVLLSMVMVAPESTRNAVLRILFGSLGSIIFTPITQQIGWFSGDEFEIVVAAGCLTGFVCWFILEFIARLMSARRVLDSLFVAMLRMRGMDTDQIEIALGRDEKGKRKVEIKEKDG